MRGPTGSQQLWVGVSDGRLGYPRRNGANVEDGVRVETTHEPDVDRAQGGEPTALPNILAMC